MPEDLKSRLLVYFSCMLWLTTLAILISPTSTTDTRAGHLGSALQRQAERRRLGSRGAGHCEALKDKLLEYFALLGDEWHEVGFV